MTFNSGIVRTLVASLVVLLAVAAVTSNALAREIRIFPVAAPFPAPCAATSACDLVRAAAGFAPTTGPDAGVVPGPGDTLILAPGVYTLAAATGGAGGPVHNGTGSVIIPGVATAPLLPTAMENLKIRSRDGANVTIIDGAALGAGDVAAVIIGADGVDFGGPGADQGITVRNGGVTGVVNVDGVQIGTPAIAAGGLAGVPITPAGQADEFITFQNNIVENNMGDGLDIASVSSLESINVISNKFLGNIPAPLVGGFFPASAAQIHVRVASSVGDRGPDRNIVFEDNDIDGTQAFGAGGVLNSFIGILFINGGNIEQTAILNNRVKRHAFAGLFVAPPVTDFETSIIAGNFFQQNIAVGIGFANIGQVEDVRIEENRGTTLQEGITGNGIGLLTLFPFLSDFQDTRICDNNFNANTVAGTLFLMRSDFENVEYCDNSVRQNGVIGHLAASLGGDLTEVTYARNEVRNNGAVGIVLLTTVGRIQEHTFDANLISESTGVGLLELVVSPSDLETHNFINGNEISKNGLAGLILATGPGDIGEISFDDLNVLENGGSGALFVSGTGDITNVEGSNSRFDNNGGFGLAVAAVAPTPIALTSGDVDNVTLSDSTFSNNGTRAAIGLGSGLFFRGDNVTTFALSNIESSSNNDHGVQWSANEDVSEVDVQGGDYSDNDRNVDGVGNGLDISTNDTANDVTINEVTANDNNTGARFNVSGRSGRDMVVSNSTFNFNRDTGILFDGSEDLVNVGAEGNSLEGNAIGINFSLNEDGSGLFVRNNEIVGNNGSGTGLLLDAVDVSVEDNSIRKNAFGVKVRKMEDNSIHNNNIARNDEFGVDASALAPGESIDATNNWWGEPSGPQHPSNPNGIGDEVTDRVEFDPYLGEPAVPTDVNFQITSFNVPSTANAGESTTITATVQNNGTEEGTQTLLLKIEGSDFVDQRTVTRTLNPATTVDVDFSVVFPRGGTFTVTLETPNDSAEATIEVTGPTGLTIEDVIDANDNNRIDDDEILTAIGFWVSGDEVPGTGQSISDAKILFLIELWVTGGDISTLPASAAAPQNVNWLEALIGLFSSAVKLEQQAEVTDVTAGSSFTATTTIKANEGVQGLLLSERLPDGWTISEVTTAGGFFKPSENKWLWLNGNDITVSYTVHVPANAAVGSYDIMSSLDTMDGASTNNTLRVNVVQPNILSIDNVAFTGSQFVAEGTGIVGLDVRVYNLSGQLVFESQNNGATLSFNGLSNNGQTLANGVYLYVVTVNGSNGQQVRTNVGKMVVLR